MNSRPMLILLAGLTYSNASAEQLVVDHFEPAVSAPAWTFVNASLDRSDGEGVKLARGDKSLSYVILDLDGDLQGRRLRIEGQICCDIDPHSANVWATFYEGSEPQVTFHGVPVEHSKKEGVLSIMVPAYPGSTMVRIGAFNSSEKDVHLQRFKASSMEPPSVTPRNRITEIADLVAAKSVYLSEENGTQHAAFLEYAKQLAASADTGANDEHLVGALLKYAGDVHSRFLGGAPGQSGPQSQPQTTSMHPWSTIVGNVGYVEVPGTTAASPESVKDFRELLTRALSEFEGRELKSVVVDLRRNSGGNMWPAICAFQPMLPEEFGYFLYPDGRKVSWAEVSEQVAPLMVANTNCAREKSYVSPETPLYVLLSGDTASAGEAVAIALLSRSGSISAGSPTMGLTSANEPVNVSDGNTIVLAASWMAGSDGVAKKGPLVPDIQIELPLSVGEHKADISLLTKQLQESKSRRPVPQS